MTLPPLECVTLTHLTPQYGSTSCKYPGQLVLLHRRQAIAACRACAAVFALHHMDFTVTPIPGAAPTQQLGPLSLTGKQRSEGKLEPQAGAPRTPFGARHARALLAGRTLLISNVADHRS